jgi:hypothetical protein
MRYQKEFFDLQLQFARRVAEISGAPLEQAILDYTNLYIRFAIDRSFSPEHPVWLDYVEGLKCASDIDEWTYRFYSGVRTPSRPVWWLPSDASRMRTSEPTASASTSRTGIQSLRRR